MAASDRLLKLDGTNECSYSTNSKPSVLDRLKCAEVSENQPSRWSEEEPAKLFTKPHLHPEIYHTDATSEGVL